MRIKDYPNLDPLITYYAQGSDPIDPQRAAQEEVPPEPESVSAYWEQPGRSIVVDGLLAVPHPPRNTFDSSASTIVGFVGDACPSWDVKYEASGRKVQKEGILLSKEMTWELLDKYGRTWSALPNYMDKFPEERKKRIPTAGLGGEYGDILDRFLFRMKEELRRSHGSVPKTLTIEWPTNLLLFRKVT
jgi:trans-aconitate 3-methyltransferase